MTNPDVRTTPFRPGKRRKRRYHIKGMVSAKQAAMFLYPRPDAAWERACATARQYGDRRWMFILYSLHSR